MIVCRCIWFSYIITFHIMRHLCFLAKVLHTTRILFAILDTMSRYNVIWPFKVTHVLVSIFFFKNKICVFAFKRLGVLSFAFFFIPSVSIASCWLVLLVGLWFLVLLVPFMSVICLSLVKFFDFLCPLKIVSKRERYLRFECHSSGGVIDLGGELHVKGKKFFWCN